MAEDWDAVAADVAAGIAEVGGAAAIRRTTHVDAAGTPWDPSDDTETATDHACTVVLSDYTLRERETTLIAAGDRKALISTGGLTIEPTPADLLVIDGTAREIVHVKPTQPAPGGAVLLYEAQVRF